MGYDGPMPAEKQPPPIGKYLPAEVVSEITEVLTHAFGAGRSARSRGRGTAERLSADRIVDVALEQMREHGYDAVTMRSIARQLGTGPASLYAHVADRAALDQMLVDRVSREWRIPDPDPARWAEQLRESLFDLARLYQAHPGVARCTLGMIPSLPATLIATERLLAIMRAGDVPDQYAAWFVDSAALYVAGAMVEDDMWRERAAGTEIEVVDKVRSIFSGLPPEHFPLITSMATVLTTGDGDDRFGFGLDLLISGLQTMSERARQR